MWAESLKLLGNSFYGKLCTNPYNYRNVRVVKHREASELINSKSFKSIQQVRNQDCYIVSNAQDPVREKYPIQISLFSKIN